MHPVLLYLHLGGKTHFMKTLKATLFAFVLLTAAPSFGQSKSFETLYDHFSGTEDVNCFSISGFFCRAGLWVAGEHEFKDAVEKVSSIRLITIPLNNFRAQGLSLNGYRKVLAGDDFESLATIKESESKVEIYLQQTDNNKNRYLVLVEERAHVTAIEMRGYIDVDKLKKIATEKMIAETL